MTNVLEDTPGCTVITPSTLVGRSLAVFPGPSTPIGLTLTAVVPETLPTITSLSAAPETKFTFRATVPPPVKLPVAVRTSFASASVPTSSVPDTSMTPAARLCAPAPNLTVEPVPMRTVSHPVTSARAPENPLNVSVSRPSPPLIAAESIDAPP